MSGMSGMSGWLGADECAFATFCDAFQTRHPGGRAGDLDE